MDIFGEKGLSFERLRTLVRVRECGGVARAAPGDVVRQNLIGRQLRELEEFFGAKLTAKQGKVLSLNSSGVELASVSSQVLTMIGDFKCASHQKRKPFRVAAGGTLYGELAAPRLASLRSLNLEVHLSEMIETKIFKALHESRVDCAITWGTHPSSLLLKSVTLGHLDYALYGAKEIVKKLRAEDALFSLPFVVVRYRDMTTDIEGRLRSDEVVFVDENIPALRLVASGHYVAILPTLLGAHLPKKRFTSVNLAFLNNYRRRVNFYWNPRGAALRGFSATWMEQVATRFRQ